MAPAMKRLDPVFEAPVTPVPSPTGMTNAIRRPKSPRTQRKVSGFLAAEHFSTMSQMSSEAPQLAERGRTRGRVEMGTFNGPPKFHGTKLKNTSVSPEKQPPIGTFHYAQSSAFSIPSFPRAKKADNERTPCTNSFVMPTDIRRSIQGCIRPSRISSVGSTFQGCITATAEKKRQFETCSTTTCNIYEEECKSQRRVRGRNRGGDHAFFMDAPSDTVNSLRSTESSIASSLSSVSEVEEHDIEEKESIVKPPEETIRTRTRRYPDAALIKNPLDARREEMIRQTPVDEEVESAIDNPIEDESPLGLQQLRISLFQKSHDEKTVPKARLSRALTELTIQDGAIMSLQQELNNVTGALDRSLDNNKITEDVTEKHQRALNDMMAKTDQQKAVLKNKLILESTEKVKLQSRVTALEAETSQLRSSLRLSKAQLTKQSMRWTEAIGGGDRAQNLPPSTDLKEGTTSPFESALLTALRAEVVELKSKLDDAKAANSGGSPLSSRSKSPNASSRADVVLLRVKLSRAEQSLREMHAKERTLTSSKDQAENDLVQALKKSRDETTRAMAKENELRRTLHVVMKELESIKKIRLQENEKSTAFKNSLTARLVATQEETERSQSKALEELNELRRDAEELRGEVAALTEQLMEAKEEARRHADVLAKERTELHLSSQSNQALSDAVEVLKEKLARAEEFASAAQGNKVVFPVRSTVHRNVKRRIEEELNPGDIKALAQESSSMTLLAAQLEESRGNEVNLRGEVDRLKGLLRQAEKKGLKGNSKTDVKSQALEVQESSLSSQVDRLSAILASHESNAVRSTGIGNSPMGKCYDDDIRSDDVGMKHDNEKNDEELLAEADTYEMKEVCATFANERQSSPWGDIERPLRGKASTGFRNNSFFVNKLRGNLGMMPASTSAVHKEKYVTSPTKFCSMGHLDVSPSRSESSNEGRSPPLSPPILCKSSSQRSLASILGTVDELSASSINASPRSKIFSFRNTDSAAIPRSAKPRQKGVLRSSPQNYEAPHEQNVPKGINDSDDTDSTIERLDINSLQARMLESSKRLTDATFKLKGLVISSEELSQSRSNQLTSNCRLSPITAPTRMPRVVSPDEKVDKVRSKTTTTDDVLEKYLKYRENKMHPNR